VTFMSEAVKCDICGALYNSRYLASHKRWAHAKKEKSEDSDLTEPEATNRIVSLFERLSPEGRKRLLQRLTRS
jgi:hypothetical protein